jgi:predicted metal-dependent peptidase
MEILKFDSYNKYLEFVNENESSNLDKNELQQRARKAVNRGVAMAIGKYPFFGELLSKCRFLYDHPEIDTMATDGHNIYINSLFSAGLSEDQRVFILCHEVLHIVLLHHLRMKEIKDANTGKKWNYACDYELNPLLVADGLLSAEEVKAASPKGIQGLYDEKYLGMSAETIYRKLDDDAEDSQPPRPYTAKIGDIVKTKSGEWGQIDSIDANGNYDINLIPEAQARAIVKSRK